MDTDQKFHRAFQQLAGSLWLGCRPTQKSGGPWTKYKQNANWGIRTVATKTSIKQIPWSVSI